jgi:SNF2 family DNA or RNA helicase
MQGVMWSYQLEGLKWMIDLYDCKASGMLADEMGLGKTVQTISLLAYLKQIREVNGPHLVLVPLTTLSNWEREFHRWCPDLQVLTFHGDKRHRRSAIAAGALTMRTSEVLLTTFEIAIKELAAIHMIPWCVVVVDEGQRILQLSCTSVLQAPSY